MPSAAKLFRGIPQRYYIPQTLSVLAFAVLLCNFINIYYYHCSSYTLTLFAKSNITVKLLKVIPQLYSIPETYSALVFPVLLCNFTNIYYYHCSTYTLTLFTKSNIAAKLFRGIPHPYSIPQTLSVLVFVAFLPRLSIFTVSIVELMPKHDLTSANIAAKLLKRIPQPHSIPKTHSVIAFVVFLMFVNI